MNSGHWMASRAAPGASVSGETLGAVFYLLLLWLFFEFGRPPRPFGIPLMISLVALLTWIPRKDKQLDRYGMWWIALLAVMAIGIAFASNTYAAFWTTRDMAVRVLCICLPLQALLTSVRSIRLWIYTFLAVALYVGGWAATHGGFGPSAGGGGQDENYIAALMGLSIAFAYFSLFSERRLIPKVMLGCAIVIFLAAIALAENPSRGGFIGLCVVGAYCVSRSPKRLVGVGLLGLMGVSLLVIAGPAFWAEIRTSADFQSGTGDVRLELWKAGFRMWEANPVFGVGAGNFRWVIGDYQSAAQFAKFGRSLGGSIIAHSLPVELLAELGLGGVLATAALLWHTWTGLGKVRDAIPTTSHGPVDRDLAQLRCFADAIRAGMLAILVNGVFLSLLYYPHMWLLISVGSAVPFVYRRIQGRMSTASPVCSHTTGRNVTERASGGALPASASRYTNPNADGCQ